MKTIRLVLLVAFGLFLTVGVVAAQDPVTVTIQHQFTDDESAKLDELIAQFEAENPGIVIETIRDNDNAYYDKLVTTFLGGSAPDIVRLEPPRSAQFTAAGFLAPVDAYFPEDVRDDYFPGTLEPLIADDQLYGIPQAVDTLVLFYRSDLLEEAGYSAPPATWDELVEIATAVTDAPDRYGIGLFGGWGGFEFYPWLWQAGAEMLAEEDGQVVPVFNSPEAVNALQFWVDLQNTVMPPGAATLTEDDMIGPFIAGDLAMFTSGPWVVSRLEEAGIDGKWAIAPLPSGEEAATVLGGMALSITAASEHPVEAGAFLNWFMQDEIQADWASSLGLLPVKRTLYALPEFADNALLQQFLGALETARTRPTIAEAGELDGLLGTAVQAALSGVQTPQEALDDAVAQAIEVLSE